MLHLHKTKHGIKIKNICKHHKTLLTNKLYTQKDIKHYFGLIFKRIINNNGTTVILLKPINGG
jgi:hypothetical protein